ncbi:polysaccharide biosynthesis C-terminal domain-containing protein [Patescibacteria group bacterium]|nr:polysaccharide biosynthesis C-terminal domain-containing protein [Patescibacteria group bacterium]MBU1758049.1 polysaccharide biosynthesis C-terminal domain-containing protein [Patescibacteria group bacterium]
MVNIAANLILIPRFGPLGAAYSLAIAEVCLMITYRWYIYRYIRRIK